MVDILWDHLVLLQQDVDRDAAALKIVPSNLCKTLTEPVSMPRLPPSPPGAQQPQYHQSPQKTYLTLSPQRHLGSSRSSRQSTEYLTSAAVSSHYHQYN